MRRPVVYSILGSIALLAVLFVAPGCDDEKQQSDKTEKTEQPAEPKVTEWSIKFSGVLEGSYEGDRWALTETGHGDTLLVLRPVDENDREFTENTEFYVQLPADKLGESGSFDVPPGRAGFQLYKNGEKDHTCGTREATKIELETYTKNRIQGSYASTMTCAGRSIDMDVTFDIFRNAKESNGHK